MRVFNWADGLDGNLKAWLHITYTRTTTESAHRLLDNIGATFRNSEELETELELTDGQTISNDDMRLRKRVNIDANEGVLIADKAFEAMHRWVQRTGGGQATQGLNCKYEQPELLRLPQNPVSY